MGYLKFCGLIRRKAVIDGKFCAGNGFGFIGRKIDDSVNDIFRLGIMRSKRSKAFACIKCCRVCFNDHFHHIGHDAAGMDGVYADFFVCKSMCAVLGKKSFATFCSVVSSVVTGSGTAYKTCTGRDIYGYDSERVRIKARSLKIL